jgi:hypothetical protein
MRPLLFYLLPLLLLLYFFCFFCFCRWLAPLLWLFLRVRAAAAETSATYDARYAAELRAESPEAAALFQQAAAARNRQDA